ncbi:MAG: cell wall hydrolase [Lachnospiraceae bacterium]|nr:cell wall hydrolase [Lachnospiraceae bacterium]
MYRKSVSLLVMLSIVFLSCFCCIRGLNFVRLYTEPAEMLTLKLWELDEKAREREKEWMLEEQMRAIGEESMLGIVESASSKQRIIDVCILEQEYIYELPEEELEVLMRIVESEAGTEDEEGKLLVANVVLNRMTDAQFPDTIAGVVFQKEKGIAQFSPVSDGTYYQVDISDETVRAVERALLGEDISQGALYFAARKYADNNKMKWFDENLSYLFVHGGHEFFK